MPAILPSRIGDGNTGIFPFGELGITVTGGGGDPDPDPDPEPSDPWTDYTLSVTAVAENITGFPLNIDLTKLPSGFWTKVNSSGGNIRVYAANGTTQLPHDITYFNKTGQLGRLFARTDLSTAGTTIIVRVLDDQAATAPAVGDTYGRNAVWADFAVAVVFPDDTNRTGGVGRSGSVENRTDWIEIGYKEFTGDPHQGIAVDSTGRVITIDTNYLRRYAASDLNTVLASNANPIASTGIASVNHLGDGCIIGDELFVVLEVYPNSPYNNQHICVFDADTLAFKRSYDISSYAHEVSGVAYDGTNLWITDFTVDNKIHKYNLTGTRLEVVTLSQNIVDMQSVTVIDGKLLISSDTTAHNYYEVEFNGTVNGVVYVRPTAGINEGLSYVDGKLYVMDGDGDCVILQRLSAYKEWRKVHNAALYFTMNPRSNVFSMAASCRWADPPGDLQQGFLSYANGTTDANRATVAYDEGPDSLAIWNSVDGWAYASIKPAPYSTFRLSAVHNDTVVRKLFVDGVKKVDDAGIAARPAGTGTTGQFVINASETGAEEGFGYYQYIWLRHNVVSDAWMAADYANHHDDDFVTLAL